MASRRSETPGRSYKYLVSACLAGVDCTHSGKNKLNRKIKRLVGSSLALAVCPEVLGGQPVPRQTCEIVLGDGADVLDGLARVRTSSGIDVSKPLIRGARKALSLAKKHRIKSAILKSNSPSCGVGHIYDGTFSRRLIRGDGVTAALFKRNYIKVRTEKD